MLRTRPNRPAHRHLLAWLALLCCLPALADPAAIAVGDGWVRATPPGVRTAAAFLTLHNRSNTALELLGVSCETTVAARCEIHRSTQGSTGMRMEKVERLPVAAGETLRFAPGGLHIMLVDIAAPLAPGMQVELVFTFSGQSRYHARLPVKPVQEE